MAKKLAAIRDALSHARTLPADGRHRHHALVALMLAQAVGLSLFALAEGYSVFHGLSAGAVIVPIFVSAAAVASIMAWRLNETVRNQSERAYRLARDNEERFRGAFEGAPIGMAMVSIDEADAGRFLQVNSAMSRFTGRSEEELLKLTIRDISHPDDLRKSEKVMGRLINGEIEHSHFEKRYMHAEGHTIWGALSVSVIHTTSGEPAYVISQIEDITERRRAVEQLAHQAYTDALTGLRNRWGLMTDLETRIDESSSSSPAALVLLDLDGFKAYNDAFGHPAGDVLLKRLGTELATVIDGKAVAYRMGGDEFCVLGLPGGVGGGELAAISSAALAESGQGFEVTASGGCVLLPVEASNAEEALRIADQRMYARKAGGRASAGRQSADVLLKSLSERNPDLGVHLDAVTDLCEAIAHRLDIPAMAVGPLLQAASLHDVGKAAIPDATLNKPGAPDENEWRLLRQHTLIGERILGVAPALSRAAKLVRWSHERVDGKGYPDGLRGEDIPLGSRIITVCDSYDAMISDRPYREAKSTADALIELRRCAGTQFDPRVVESFIAEIAERESAPLVLA